jgi:2-hydroxychromene-2-carboxylate isomerase
MGDLIILSDRRAARHPRPARAPARAAFYFDVSCPFSYLAAERVERLLGNATWIPAAGVALYQGQAWGDPRAREEALARAERRAAALRLPLVWPERFPAQGAMALRAAAHATEIGAGPAFALAASRLAFCGGFDLEDPEILAEAAAAAGIGLDACIAAAGDESRDGALEATGRGLLARGVTRLPAFHVGRRWFDGESRIAEAAASASAHAAFESPLAPVG